jgi:hypothetical protein
VRVTGPVAPARAWERYADPARWAGWAPQIRRVVLDGAGGARIAPGLRGRVHGPAGLRVDFVVTAVDEAARTWSWTARLGPVRLHLDHGVAADPRGTATTLVVDGPAPVVLAYLPVTRLALRRLVRPLS